MQIQLNMNTQQRIQSEQMAVQMFRQNMIEQMLCPEDGEGLFGNDLQADVFAQWFSDALNQTDSNGGLP